MENLETYIAFDLEFNTVDGVRHIRTFLCSPLSMV